MRSMTVRFGSVLAILLPFALIGPASPALARSYTRADLAVLRIITPTAPVTVGTRIKIVAVAANLGPDDLVGDSLDVHYDRVSHLRILRERCSFGISPDTPYCEFGEVAAGTRVRVIIIGRVRASSLPAAVHIRFCTSNEAAVSPDPDPENDCRAARIEIAPAG